MLRHAYGNASLQVRFAIQAALSTLILFVLVMVLVLYVQRRALLDSVEARGLAIAHILASVSGPFVASDDYEMLQSTLDGFKTEAGLLYAMILGLDGQVLAHVDAARRGTRYWDERSLVALRARGDIRQWYVVGGVPAGDFAVPVKVRDKETRAIARIGLSIEREMGEISRTGRSIVFLGLAALTFSLIWAGYQSRKLTRPLEALVDGTREITRGNLDHRLRVGSSDETGQLAVAFNQMVEQLAAAQKGLVDKTRMAAIGELSAMVAHETRNPLGALSTCLQLLRRGSAIAGEDAELVQIMEGEVQRLNTMVSDFLAFGRPPAPRIELVDLQEVVANVLALLRRDQRTPPGVSVVSSVDAAARTVKADAAQVHQILWNLALNATQAMNGAGTVTVKTARRGDRIEVEVADTGRGIDADSLPRIFEPFFTTRSNGSGLGLAVVKRILDEHGGDIRVESQPGAGTTVVVRLPSDA